MLVLNEKAWKFRMIKKSEKDNGKQAANKKITLFTSDVGKIISSFYHGVCSQIIRKMSKNQSSFLPPNSTLLAM